MTNEREERINVITHAFGCLMSVVGLILLVYQGFYRASNTYMISMVVFGVSLIALYAASTAYHYATTEKRKYQLQIVDHAAIFLLIAGTYTPYTLLVLPEPIGWQIFTIIWSLAVVGIILKLFFTGRFSILSTLFYVGMGWIVIFAFQPLLANFPFDGIVWLLMGGVAYTVGAVIFSMNKIPYNHAIWHCFVLAGSFCHFVSVYGYI